MPLGTQHTVGCVPGARWPAAKSGSQVKLGGSYSRVTRPPSSVQSLSRGMSALQLGNPEAGPDVSQILLKMKRGISKWQVIFVQLGPLTSNSKKDKTGSGYSAHRLGI